MPAKTAALDRLAAIDAETGCVNAIIETPKGGRNKYKYDPERAVFTLGAVLPIGKVFPYDFGFIPSTRGEDGDPLDILVLLDAGVPTGCLVQARLIGVIEAEQSAEGSRPVRNDRLLAVALHAETHQHVRTLRDLHPKLVDEIEAFFVDYQAQRGKRFKPLHRRGPREALALVKDGIAAARQ